MAKVSIRDIYEELASGEDINRRVYFRRNLFGGASKKVEEEQDKFYGLLKRLEEESIYQEYYWSAFYHYTRYFTEDGMVYEYQEDNDYMIPYSIDRYLMSEEQKVRMVDAKRRGVVQAGVKE